MHIYVYIVVGLAICIVGVPIRERGAIDFSPTTSVCVFSFSEVRESRKGSTNTLCVSLNYHLRMDWLEATEGQMWLRADLRVDADDEVVVLCSVLRGVFF